VATANCSNRAVVHAPQGNCWALFYDPEEDPSASTASSAGADGASGAQDAGTTRRPGSALLESLIGTPETKAQAREREQRIDHLRQRSAKPSAALQSDEPVLDYLLGDER
jgi:hypothetical protein